ncbi:hypothetical protein Acsp03_60610 [Actinomadura sp. NBRC 104412]|uniref:hypothetical protein n=1 Tax=Actinomadura sp. NBRC 104412 TaxID=3032203 RepID=UPI0024A33D62|nr:hypothetical protein [Actinomadura sp. NBRC 104412]GLZ08595.1 hypothetical protein Acsp03_60610 [Actinomadura sp. NBRC 104412]
MGGLQRSPEPFQRVYSPPEPPAPARRPRVLVLLVAAAAVVLTAGGVFVLLPDGEPGGRGDRQASVGEAAPSPSSPASGPEPITALPPPCETVPAATVRSLVPGAQRRASANQTLTTCTYSSGSDGFRWLRVEAHLYSPANTPTPVEDARRYYGAQWTQAHNATLERTVSLARHPGMGDEAYRWFKEDRGQPTVVGQVTVRLRNTVITVGYSERSGGAGGAEAREEACLDKATRVAREVLRAFR